MQGVDHVGAHGEAERQSWGAECSEGQRQRDWGMTEGEWLSSLPSVLQRLWGTVVCALAGLGHQAFSGNAAIPLNFHVMKQPPSLLFLQ